MKTWLKRYPDVKNLQEIYGFIGTVKLGDKERFDKEQIGVKEPFLWPIVNLLHKD